MGKSPTVLHLTSSRDIFTAQGTLPSLCGTQLALEKRFWDLGLA